jgi:hypothetical protein
MTDRVRIELSVGNAQGNVVTRAELADIGFIIIRLTAAKMMVDMCGPDFDPAHFQQSDEQGRGVNAAGDCDDDGAALDFVQREKAADGLDDHGGKSNAPC